MSDIRTPDDEVTTPGYFYPPFTEGWTYQGATYPGHSDFAVDFNRRTPSGGWLQDLGDPVLAIAEGTVAAVDKAEGLVMLNHPSLWRSEYRHMQDITVKVGDKVQRGDRIGSIGSVGNSTSPHLHHRHWKRPAAGKPFAPVKMAFLGIPLAVSVHDSDTRPKTWEPPTPVMVQGQPERATWQGAYQEAAKLLTKTLLQLDNAKIAKGLAEDELAQEKAAHVLTQQALHRANEATGAADREVEAVRAKLDACEERPIPDCTAIAAERDGALQRATIEQQRAAAVARDLETATRTITAQGARIEELEARVAELEALPPPSDCITEVNAERARVLAAISDGMDELVAGLR